MKNAPFIRRANFEDLSILQELTHQLGYKIDLSVLSENMKAYLEEEDCSLLVAMIGKDVVGYIALDAAQTFHRKGKHMRVVSLVVKKEQRKRGIGRLLLQAGEEWAKKMGCWVIELTSSHQRQKEGTHDFYQKEGYLKEASAYFSKLLPSNDSPNGVR